jgi:putative endonuclease
LQGDIEEIRDNTNTIPAKAGIQVLLMRTYFVYILASNRNGTLYVGFTSDLLQRIYVHKNNLVQGFTKKYGVHRLVNFESCDDYDAALQREKQIKEWKRSWKIELIEKSNPLWQDLYDETLKNG